MEKRIDFRIDEYKEGDMEGVIDAIDTTLRDIGVISKTAEKIDNDDLFKIPEVYSGRGRFWVAKVGKKIIGTVAVKEVDEQTVVLNRMFVLVEYHGSGLGQKLFDVAIDFVREQSFKKMILDTDKAMSRAHRFYEKNGFVRVGESGSKYLYEIVL